MNIFDISSRYKFLTDHIAANDGEIPDDFVQLMDSLEVEFQDKVESLVLLIKEAEADKEKFYTFRQRIAKKESALLRSVETMKRYILNGMKVADIKRVETIFFSVVRRSKGTDLTRTQKDGPPITQEEIEYCERVLENHGGDFGRANITLGLEGFQYKASEYITIKM